MLFNILEAKRQKKKSNERRILIFLNLYTIKFNSVAEPRFQSRGGKIKRQY